MFYCCHTDEDGEESEDIYSSDEASSIHLSPSNIYLGKDGKHLSKQIPPENIRSRGHNIVPHLAEAKPIVKCATTPHESWSYMIYILS